MGKSPLPHDVSSAVSSRVFERCSQTSAQPQPSGTWERCFRSEDSDFDSVWSVIVLIGNIYSGLQRWVLHQNRESGLSGSLERSDYWPSVVDETTLSRNNPADPRQEAEAFRRRRTTASVSHRFVQVRSAIKPSAVGNPCRSSRTLSSFAGIHYLLERSTAPKYVFSDHNWSLKESSAIKAESQFWARVAGISLPGR